MNRFWDCIIHECFKKANVKTVVEIGCDKGQNTDNLIYYCAKNKGFLHIIDPSPSIDVEEKYREFTEYYQYHKALSLNVLWDISNCDAVLIDGDHNWYTVFNELKMIEKNMDRFPIVMFHDISWPYDRRDLYYNPDNIPEAYRFPYEKAGIDPDTNELTKIAGFNRHLYNSIYYNNQHSGVLTAVEDFIRESEKEFIFKHLPIMNGFGLMYAIESGYSDEFVNFANNIQPPESILPLLTKTDKRYAKLESNYIDQKKVNDSIKKELDSTKEELDALNSELLHKQEQLNRSVSDATALYEELRISTRNEIKRLEIEKGDLSAESASLLAEIDRLKEEQSNLKYNLNVSNQSVNAANIQSRRYNPRGMIIASLYGALKYGLKTAYTNQKAMQILRKHGGFDYAEYLYENPDILESWMDPLVHFIWFGGYERRNPNRDFNSSAYLSRYPDVAHSRINPYAHYLLFGKAEGRQTNVPQSKKLSIDKKIISSDMNMKQAEVVTAGNVHPKPLLNKEQIIEKNRGFVSFKAVDHDAPLVSIILVNHNCLEHLKKLFSSFERSKFYSNFEIIVVDNASKDESMAYIEKKNINYHITFIYNNKNESFSYANNRGAETAKGDYLLFLNCDTEVTDGWLDELMNVALSYPNAGAIGTKLVYPEVPDSSLNRGKSFLIQHAGVGFRWDENDGTPFLRPYNLSNGTQVFGKSEELPQKVAAVTAAAMLVKKTVYWEAGGFDEGYQYGLEDVDLCLKIGRCGYSNYYCPTALLFHYEFGSQEKSDRKDIIERRTLNKRLFQTTWQTYLEDKIMFDKLAGGGSFCNKPLTVAFAVTEAHDNATAGDYFTALELAGSLEKLGFNICYLCRKGPGDWYEVSEDIDVIISMLDSYNLNNIKSAGRRVITMAWARNWFERWAINPSIHDYTYVFATSQKGIDHLTKITGRQDVVLYPIATNFERFFTAVNAPENEADKEKYSSDYVFTGSYWNDPRDIIEIMHPEELPYKAVLFGQNWEMIPHLKSYTKGFIAYREMPLAYKYTKIVIDDANRVTKDYGAVNSRVYDALAAGRLVLTNGIIGAEETFGGLLPTFSSRAEFESLIKFYMENEDKRMELTKKLQQYVFENHTYDIRAKKLLEILSSKLKFDEKSLAIMVPAPKWETVDEWGDYHFAVAMKNSFEKNGYRVEIRILSEWDKPFMGKTVVVLRGLSEYLPKKHHVNIMWNISHPDKVLENEYNRYDMVYVASLRWADDLSSRLKTHVMPLMQCTDPELFQHEDQPEKKYQILFVGNSRKVMRRILNDLLPTKYSLSVFGTNWQGLIPNNYIKGEHIQNKELWRAYGGCDILLNDHWDDMREKGFISNRIFDGLAAGAFIISDNVSDLDELLPDCIVTYGNKNELAEKLDYYLAHPEERVAIAEKGKKMVIKNHTFDQRVNVMLRFIEDQEV